MQNLADVPEHVFKPVIPPPYKYAKEFDTLRSMGFPSRQIVAALDSAEGDVELAASMLLSGGTQEVPDIPEEPVPTPIPPPQPSQKILAAATTAQIPVRTTQEKGHHDYPQETKLSGKKKNPYSDIIDLLKDNHPNGVYSSQLKQYFLKKYGRNLPLPEGTSMTAWMRSIRGVTISEWREGGNTVFYYAGSEGDTHVVSPSNSTLKGAKMSATAAGQGHSNPGHKEFEKSSIHPLESRPNDWYCSGCDNMNFASRTSCFVCHESKEMGGNNNHTNKKEKENSQPIVEKPHDMKVLSTFKTIKCTKSACFTSMVSARGGCPFWHTEGDACLFTHNVFEAMFHPLKYRKLPCRHRGPLNGPNLCPAVASCSFFHSLDESRNSKDIALVEATATTKATPVTTAKQAVVTPATAPHPPMKSTKRANKSSRAYEDADDDAFYGAARDGTDKADYDAAAAVDEVEMYLRMNAKGGYHNPGELPALKVGGASASPSPSPSASSQSGSSNSKSTTPTPSPAPSTASTAAVSKSANNIAAAAADEENRATSIPSDFLCCLSKKLMEDPVLAADGMTYERAVIEAYFHNCKLSDRDLVSPITGLDLLHTFLAPNIAIKILIDDWRSKESTKAVNVNAKETIAKVIPGDYLCCLSKKLMEDPVLAADGMTYERAVIERYIKQETDSKRRLISPVNGEPLLYPNLVSNFAIKVEIDKWRSGTN